jgi:hypothetical protein
MEREEEMQMDSIFRDLRPEDELLVCCARTRVDDERAGRIRALLRGEIDWAYLLRRARDHHMMPLLHHNLNINSPQDVPTPILDKLRDHFHTRTRHNLILTGELLKLLKLFEGGEIQAVPLRGPALAASLYGDLALRQFGDLDILVQRQDVLRVKDLLVSSGYRPLFPLPAREEAIFWRGEHTFILEPGGVLVDLHWDVNKGFFSSAPDQAVLWERIERTSLEGHSILGLSREDLFMLLCMHGAKHNWERLDWICDIAEYVRVHGEMDWHQTLEEAGELGIKRMISLGLFLANSLLGAELPEDVRKEVRADRVVKSLAGQVCKGLFREAGDRTGFVEKRLFYLRSMERLRDRIGHLFDRVITPTPWVWELVRLPSTLFFLYYLIRPLELVGRHGLRRSGPCGP